MYAPLSSIPYMILYCFLRPVGVRPSKACAITRKYSYLIYYVLDQSADEIVILTIQHSAREREYEDA